MSGASFDKLEFELSNTTDFLRHACNIQMGNKNIKSLPSVVTKNWYPINPDGDVFKSKLTSECVREQVIQISNPNKIQQLKSRIKQTNPYICRVVFYYHLVDDVYYVYTDETRNRPLVHNLVEWKIHKQNIVQAFIQLAQQYGPTHVCKEMIGVDLNGQIKVWINPNPALTVPWSPCSTEAEMIADILAVCRLIGEQANPFRNKQLQQTQTRGLMRSHLCSSGFTKTFQHQFQQPQSPNLMSRQSFNKVEKYGGKFIPQASRRLKGSVTNLKTEDTKTNSSENEKEKHDISIQNNSLLSLTKSKDKFSLEDGNFVWDRTKTQVFDNPFSKKSSRRELGFHINMSLKNNVRSPSERISKDKTKMFFQNKANLQEIQSGRKNPENRDKWLDPNHNRIKSAIRTDRSHEKCSTKKIQRGQRSLQHFSRQQKCEQVSHQDKQKLSSRLGNVVYMPVREERESELTFTDFHEDRKRQPKKMEKQPAPEMTISQQLLQFFDDEEKREYCQVQNRIRKKSVVYQEFKREFNQLFD